MKITIICIIIFYIIPSIIHFGFMLYYNKNLNTKRDLLEGILFGLIPFINIISCSIIIQEIWNNNKWLDKPLRKQKNSK